MNAKDTVFEITGEQLEAIIDYFAKSPNITGVELDQIFLDDNKHLVTIYSTIMYRDKRPIQHVLEVEENFPDIIEEITEENL